MNGRPGLPPGTCLRAALAGKGRVHVASPRHLQCREPDEQVRFFRLPQPAPPGPYAGAVRYPAARPNTGCWSRRAPSRTPTTRASSPRSPSPRPAPTSLPAGSRQHRGAEGFRIRLSVQDGGAGLPPEIHHLRQRLARHRRRRDAAGRDRARPADRVRAHDQPRACHLRRFRPAHAGTGRARRSRATRAHLPARLPGDRRHRRRPTADHLFAAFQVDGQPAQRARRPRGDDADPHRRGAGRAQDHRGALRQGPCRRQALGHLRRPQRLPRSAC